MTLRIYWVLSLFLLLTISPVRAVKAEGILVFAAASSTNVVDELVELYQQNGGGKVKVTTSYAGSSILAKQIYAGAPANIFISANEQWMSFLEQGDALEKNSRFNLVENSLVVVAPTDSKITLKIESLRTLAQAIGSDRIAIGDPDHVPVGIYTKQALQNLGIWEKIRSKTARMPNVRAVLAMVERGEVAAGIIYKTDATISDKVKVLAAFPIDSHQPIHYPASLVKGGSTPEAQKFFTFLKSQKALNLFTKHGFLVSN
ncbi:MAG: molybdate ABC transporter substrate-binding protein [Rhodospirillales bacterium]|nr:molybdate ABC transporter substrate-binding protein [Rhodospirillales bacterium]